MSDAKVIVQVVKDRKKASGCVGCGCLIFVVLIIAIAIFSRNDNPTPPEKPVEQTRESVAPTSDETLKEQSEYSEPTQSTYPSETTAVKDESISDHPQSETSWEKQIAKVELIIDDLKQQLVDLPRKTWTNDAGVTIEAYYRGTSNNVEIGLERIDGKKSKVDVSKLSEEDQQWIKDYPQLRKPIQNELNQAEKYKKELQQQLEQYIQEQEAEAARLAKIKGVTIAGYLAIDTGMTYREVVEILGKDGEEMSRMTFRGITTVNEVWKDGRLFGGVIDITFQNGRVTTMSQSGLK